MVVGFQKYAGWMTILLVTVFTAGCWFGLGSGGNTEEGAQCFDGYDNDCDGLVDQEESACSEDCVAESDCCRVCDEGKACGDSCIDEGLECNTSRGCACDSFAICDSANLPADPWALCCESDEGETVPCSENSGGPIQLTIEPQSGLDFGFVDIQGNSGIETLVLTAIGSGSVFLLDVRFSATTYSAFSFVSDDLPIPHQLSGGSVFLVEVKFSPTHADQYTGQIEIDFESASDGVITETLGIVGYGCDSGGATGCP